MKKNFINGTKQILWIVLAILSFTFCDKQEDDTNSRLGNLEFSFAAADLQSDLKSASMQDTFPVMRYHLLITLLNRDSVVVENRKVIPLYKFGEAFVSEKIELEKGHFFLSEFMVVGPMGDIIFAAPRYNAPLAYLVKRPLPLSFSISGNATTNLSVEVLPVKDNPPSQFGYLSFGVDIVRPLKFFASVFIDNPRIMAPSRLIPAKVTVFDPLGWSYNFEIKAKVNELVVRGNEGMYTFIVETENLRTKVMYSFVQLNNTTPEHPLMIPIGGDSVMHEFVYTTSPDSCMDALITDLNPNENYGDTKEFSASFLTEPILTVMRTNRSLMKVDLRHYLPKSASIKKVELQLTLLGFMDVNESVSAIVDSLMYNGVLKPIIEPWKENSVTWDNQPKTSSVNQVVIDYMPWMSSNRRTYDVTKLFDPGNLISYRTYGFMFIHGNEDLPGGIGFASSDNENVNMRPKFKVYYTLP